jgi:hypothetical protein
MNLIRSVKIPASVKFGMPFSIEIEYEADQDDRIFLEAEFDAAVSPSGFPADKGHHTLAGFITLTDKLNPSTRRTVVVVAQLGASVARSNGTDASP